MKSKKILEFQDYLNQIIEAYQGKNNQLSYQNIEEIQKIIDELNNLKQMGITSNNFIHKAKSFKKHLKTLKDEFGFIPHITNLPFNRPTDLKIKLDNLLKSYGLKEDAIKVIYKELLGFNVRRPKENSIKPLFEIDCTSDNILRFKNVPEYITPLIKEEHYKNIKETEDDLFYLNIEINKGDLKILKEFFLNEYKNYYLGDPELFLKDLLKTIVDEIKKEKTKK